MSNEVIDKASKIFENSKNQIARISNQIRRLDLEIQTLTNQKDQIELQLIADPEDKALQIQFREISEKLSKLMRQRDIDANEATFLESNLKNSGGPVGKLLKSAGLNGSNLQSTLKNLNVGKSITAGFAKLKSVLTAVRAIELAPWVLPAIGIISAIFLIIFLAGKVGVTSIKAVPNITSICDELAEKSEQDRAAFDCQRELREESAQRLVSGTGSDSDCGGAYNPCDTTSI